MRKKVNTKRLKSEKKLNLERKVPNSMGIKKTTWQHIRRSPYQSVAAVMTMFLTFLVAGFFFLATFASVTILNFFESKPQITVFFDDEIKTNQVDQLKKTLEKTGKVASTKYISKDEALEIYRQQNKNDPLLLEMVTADILPASLEISATDPNYLVDLESIVKDIEGIEDIIYQKDVVESLISWTNAIRVVGGALAGLLIFNSLLVIFTVVGMKIALRKDEIDILKLVGASRWYIKLPFIMEGGFYGAVGSAIASILLIVIILWGRQYILSFLSVIPSISSLLSDPTSVQFMLTSAGFAFGLILMGWLLGALGSLLSIGRYLVL
ncbi:cell division protein FtsX [Patescibacteria group bacterium]